MEENKLEVFMNEVYVEDKDLLMEAIEQGRRWDRKEITYKKDWEEEDNLEPEKEDDVRTMEVVCEMVNSIEEEQFVAGRASISSCKSGLREKFQSCKTHKGVQNSFIII